MSRNLTKEQASEMGKKGGKGNKGKLSPNSKAKLEARLRLRELIEKDMDVLYAAWKDSALGHFVKVRTGEGETKVYRKSPNALAIKDMFDRAFGKPVQPIGLEDGVAEYAIWVKRVTEMKQQEVIDIEAKPYEQGDGAPRELPTEPAPVGEGGIMSTESSLAGGTSSVAEASGGDREREGQPQDAC